MKAIVGDITKVNDIDIIVNAANGIGVMGAGVAGAIARSMGEKAAMKVREYCKKNGPFDEGSCYITDAGLLKRRYIEYIYHAVTMKYPGYPTSLNIVEKCLKSTIVKAVENDAKSIAIPGLGTGIGGLNKVQVAQRMTTILLPYKYIIDITVIDRDPLFIDTVNNSLEIRK